MPESPQTASHKHTARGAGGILLPLALTQFVASFAGSNMNVAINSIAKDLDTTIHGVQTAITLFLLCMAALMMPGSKLTDIWGRKLGTEDRGAARVMVRPARRAAGLHRRAAGLHRRARSR